MIQMMRDWVEGWMTGIGEERCSGREDMRYASWMLG